MNIHHLLILSIYANTVSAELFSIIAGTTVALSSGFFLAFKDAIKCKLYECCKEKDFTANFHRLGNDLDEQLFGQHLVKDIIIHGIQSHWYNVNPKKALVLSFHGYTGSGKNFVSSIIADNLYRLGTKSPFVHYIVATLDFPDKSKIAVYQEQLKEKILSSTKRCERNLFIFDETDKLPPSLLAAVKPYLDYYDNISGVDFRKNIFIFLSNKGGSNIAEITYRNYENSYPRENLRLNDFERILMSSTFNDDGGLKMSELISNHLIDHFIPFLPLQREHVKKCVEASLKKKGRWDLIEDSDLIERILNSLQYFPETTKAFSSSGCKRVDAKAELEIAKLKPASSSLVEDEL